MNSINVSRRRFLTSSGVLGGGLIVGFGLGSCGSETPAPPHDTSSPAQSLNAFLQIRSDGEFVFYCPRSEVGQGATTAMATLFGEELDVAPDRFTVRQAGPHPEFGNPEFGGVQGLGGSTAVKAHYLPLRQIGADTRALILHAAAQDLGVATQTLATDNGEVISGEDRYPYAAFVGTAQTLPMPTETPLKRREDFAHIGKSFPRIDALSKATGTAVYGIDVDVDGMEHAVVLRSPVPGGTLTGFDDSDARMAPGVTEIVEISNGVAIVAKSFWAAKSAAGRVKADWRLPALAQLDDASLKARYKTLLDEDEGETASSTGDLAAARLATTQAVSAEYWAPYLAHAPLEPVNALVHVKNGGAEVWAATQAPQLARRVVARTLDVDDEQIRFHALQSGGSFGRRIVASQVREATEISAVTGTPIKVQWSREDDVQSGWFRPASLMRIEAGIDNTGALTSWRAKRVGGNAFAQRFRTALPGVLPAAVPDNVIDFLAGTAEWVFEGVRVDDTSIEGLGDDYEKAAQEIRHVSVNDGLPLLYWRSVGHSFTAFAKESAIDELAHKSGIDPLELRLKNTAHDPRMTAVLKEAGKHYRALRTQGAHVGIAAHSSFHTRVAQVAAVSVEGGKIRVDKVICVVDCGLAVNPDGVRAQMEGGIIFGLGAALYSKTTLKNGRILESNFHDFRVARMADAPEIDVVIMDTDEAPTGAGEPGVPPIAPAVANAVFNATGTRLRSLPLTLALQEHQASITAPLSGVRTAKETAT